MTSEHNRIRPNFAGLLYLVALAAVSALSMLRILAAAGGLSQAAFAEYAAIVALGSFLGGMLSFGKIEGTIKSFPRLATEGQVYQIRREVRSVLYVLALRSILLSLPLLASGYFFALPSLLTLGAGFGYGFGVGCFAILASVQRAFAQPMLLLAGTAFRTLSAFVVVVAMVFFTDATLWQLVAAECLTMVFVSILSEALIFRFTPTDAKTVEERSGDTQSSGNSGLLIFLAFSLIAVPVYLDRFFVNQLFTTTDAAQYAVLAVFLLASSLLVNTLCQRIGPDIVKMAMHSDSHSAIMKYMLSWSGVAILIWGLFLTLVGVLFHFEFLPNGLKRYDISPAHLAPIFLLGAASISSIFEFYMMALDREKNWLSIVMLYLGSIVIVMAMTIIYSPTLTIFMWLLAASRLLYLILLLRATLSPKSQFLKA